MPVGVVKNKTDERHWRMAKRQAAKEGHSEDWKYVMGIYKKMSGMGKSASLSRIDIMDKLAACSAPGKKIRSRGKGKGMARGDGKGPMGYPTKTASEEKELLSAFLRRLRRPTIKKVTNSTDDLAEAYLKRLGRTSPQVKSVKAVNWGYSGSKPKVPMKKKASRIDTLNKLAGIKSDEDIIREYIELRKEALFSPKPPPLAGNVKNKAVELGKKGLEEITMRSSKDPKKSVKVLRRIATKVIK